MHDPARRPPHDRDRHAKRMVRRGQLRNLTKPADERLRVARAHANIDTARESVFVEPPTRRGETGDVRRAPAPARRRGRVEADLVHDRLRAIDVRAQLPPTTKRIDNEPPSVAREDELTQMEVPVASARPPDQLAGTNRLAGLDERVDVAVPEVPAARETADATGCRLMYAASLDRVDAMRPSGRRSLLGPVV